MLACGKYYRVWPYSDPKRGLVYITIGTSRPYAKPLCRILRLDPSKNVLEQIFDFYAVNKFATTTGQPFVTKEGLLLVPVWNAAFYTNGRTYFAIYRSDDGYYWEKVYEDLEGTYANHFFQSPFDGSIFIGVGVKGGGRKGRISYTPERAYLLNSEDSGKTWKKIFKVNSKTAIYDGAIIDEKTIIVTLREMKSIAKSINGGRSWSLDHLGTTVRNVNYFRQEEKIVISSDSSFYISTHDRFNWKKVTLPVRGLALRYPTSYKNLILMTGVGWRSFLLATDKFSSSRFYYLDISSLTKSKFIARMALINGTLLLGDEMETGSLISIKFPEKVLREVTSKEFLMYKLMYLKYSAIQALYRRLY